MNRVISPKPSAGLKAVIIKEIGKEERRRAKVYLFSAAGSFAVSLASLVWSGRYLFQALSQSGFYSYLSLIFSDFDLIFSLSGELAFSIVESAPVLEIAILLLAIVGLLFSLKVWAVNWRSGFQYSFSN